MSTLLTAFNLESKLKECIEVFNENNKKTPAIVDDLGMVVYTDGGCVGSNISGWGIHGYIYSNHETNSNSGCKSTVPTKDGYKSSANGNKAPVIAYLNFSGYEQDNVTNNTAEIKAAIKAFELISLLKVKKVLLLADSMYVLTLLNTYEKYLNNGFLNANGKPLANQDMVKQLISAYTEIKDFIEITLRHVKGHSGDFGNDTADKLCTDAMSKLRNEMNNASYTVSGIKNSTIQHEKEFFRMNTPEDYFGVSNTASKMLTEGCLFFTTNGIATNYTKRYFQGSFGEKLKSRKTDEKKIFRGKPFSDACISVVDLKEPDIIINNLINIVNSTFKETGVVEMNLSYQTRDTIYNDFFRGEINNLLVDTINNKLISANKTELTGLIYPPRLSFRLIKDYEIISGMLDEILSGNPTEIQMVKDITDLFYEVTEKKGKSAYKLLNNDEGVHRVPVEFKIGNTVKSTIIPVTLSVDCPSKISLGRLKSTNPTIKLFVFDIGARTLRYGTFIESEDGVGIWMGIYSNVHLH